MLKEGTGERQVTLLASGSEVSLALQTRTLLEDQGLGTAVVSLPCWELFEAQTSEYRAQVLGTASLRVAIEAASPFGWERYVGNEGLIIGVDHFGASAPGEDLYRNFGLTPEAIALRVREKLEEARRS